MPGSTTLLGVLAIISVVDGLIAILFGLLVMITMWLDKDDSV